MPGWGCNLEKSGWRVTGSQQNESRSSYTIISQSTPFCFVTPNVWVCAIFISHCKCSNRWVGSYPWTVDEGLDLDHLKVRKDGSSCWRDMLEKAGTWCTSTVLGPRQEHSGGSHLVLGRRQSLGPKMQEVHRSSSESIWKSFTACFCLLNEIRSVVIRWEWGSGRDCLREV